MFGDAARLKQALASRVARSPQTAELALAREGEQPGSLAAGVARVPAATCPELRRFLPHHPVSKDPAKRADCPPTKVGGGRWKVARQEAS